MDRRRFLATTSTALLAWQFPFGRRAGAEPGAPDDRPIVWEAEGINREKVAALLDALGGAVKLLPQDPSKATVVIKPNLCLPDPAARATTTTSTVVGLFCQWCISQGVRRIVVADHTLRDNADFAGIEMGRLQAAYPEVKLVLANEERMYETVAVEGKVLHNVGRMKLLSRADLFVNLATAKHHSATDVSLGVKNLMGTIWNRTDFHTTMDLSQAIGDLPLVVRPTITVIDASRVLLNGGPTGPGPVVNENRLFASKDIVAVDAVVVSRYDFGGRSLPPTGIAHLKAAAANGAGEINLEKISVRKV